MTVLGTQKVIGPICENCYQPALKSKTRWEKDANGEQEYMVCHHCGCKQWKFVEVSTMIPIDPDRVVVIG